MPPQQTTEVLAEAQEAQAIEGYGCSCGFKTDNAEEIRTHVILMSAQDGKGTHKSLGCINLQTGEVIMPLYQQRTAEQKRRSKYVQSGAMQGGTTQGGATQGGALVPLVQGHRRHRRHRETRNRGAYPHSNIVFLYPSFFCSCSLCY